jgi:hypothetical protein
VTGPTALHSARKGLQTGAHFYVPTVDRRHPEPRQHKPFHIRNDPVALLRIRRMTVAHSPRIQPITDSQCMTESPNTPAEPPPAAWRPFWPSCWSETLPKRRSRLCGRLGA